MADSGEKNQPTEGKIFLSWFKLWRKTASQKRDENSTNNVLIHVMNLLGRITKRAKRKDRNTKMVSLTEFLIFKNGPLGDKGIVRQFDIISQGDETTQHFLPYLGNSTNNFPAAPLYHLAIWQLSAVSSKHRFKNLEKEGRLMFVDNDTSKYKPVTSNATFLQQTRSDLLKLVSE